MRGRPQSRNRAFISACRVASWSVLVGVGLLVSQLFVLGHLVLFTHSRCEHGALVHTVRHGWQSETRPLATPERGVAIAPGGGNELEHDHCDPFATLPAVASVGHASTDASLLEALAQIVVTKREAEHAVAILALAPKTSPTA